MSRFRFTIGLAALAAVTALAGAGCGSSSSPTTPTVAADVTITMVGDRGNQSFSPNPTTMRVGQTVAWKNGDTTAHDATQDASRFGTGTISAGATSGRSCTTGLRRSMTSSTRRKAASANVTAVRGGSAS